MLGRTRPASPFLPWPRSTWAVRYAATSSDPSHGATPASENVADNIVPQSGKGDVPIRRVGAEPKDPAAVWASKGTSGSLKRSHDTDAQGPGPWASLENAMDEPIDAPPQRSAPARRTKTQTTPYRVERYSGKSWRHVRGSGSLEQDASKDGGLNKPPKALAGQDSESKKMDIHDQWKPYRWNSSLGAKSSKTAAHVPNPTPSSLFSAQGKKNAGQDPRKDNAPPRSKVMAEMRAWNFEIPPAAEAPIGEGGRPKDEAPPRSKIIGEMRTWNFEMAPSTEAPVAESDAVPQLTRTARAEERKPVEVLPPLDHAFREWLITAIDTAVAEAEKNRPGPGMPAVYDGPTVLVLNAASRSLLESDFYRLARQGKHLGDWAVGIARIVQARDPATYEPLGKYYIFFHTRAAALAYSEEVWRLHQLSRRAARLLSTSSPLSSSAGAATTATPGPFPLAPTLAVERAAEADLDAALRGYTLLPHSAMLDLKLYLCKDLPVPDEDRLSRLSRSLGSSTATTTTTTPPGAVHHHHGHGHAFVLVHLEGCKTTVAALHAAIARDGHERRLPWALAARPDGAPAIVAVVPDDGPSAVGGEEQQHPRGRRFWRFIVPFADAAEARRFVRNWHRREMRDLEGRNMVVTFNATALW